MTKCGSLCCSLLAVGFGVLSAGAGGVGSSDRITIRTGEEPTFFLHERPFTPIGVNYFHLHQGPPYGSFDTFDPGVYNEAAAIKDLSTISQSGYTYVRVWLSGFYPDSGFNGAPLTRDNPYIKNLISFIEHARSSHLHIVLTGSFREGQYLPKPYAPESGGALETSQNTLLMDQRFRNEFAAFYVDLLKALAQGDPHLLETLFYIDLYNELHFDLAHNPFVLHSGHFTYDGVNYDLQNSNQRQALMDRATLDWVSTVLRAVKSVNADILVAVSSFPNAMFGHSTYDGGTLGNAKLPSSSPYPLRTSVLISAGVDLIDMHLYPYPAFSSDISRVLASNEISEQTHRKLPIVVGELGAYKSIFPTPASSIEELRKSIDSLCNFGIAGWGFWMWDGPGTTWTLQDDHHVINDAISPSKTPTFCGHEIREHSSGTN